MRSTLMALCISLVMVSGAMAQPAKPLGVWDLGERCHQIRGWMTFAGLPTRSDFRLARQCSEKYGIKWVLQWGFDDKLGTPVDSEIERVQAKLAASGLTPHVIGNQYIEEWYGLSEAITVADRRAVWEFGSQQQEKIKAAFPTLPIVYVDQLVNDDPQYGAAVYMPLPRATDIFAMEMYSGPGDYKSMLELYFNYVKATVKIPLVLVGQGFYDDRYPVYPKPTEDYVEWYRGKLTDPRVIAGWLFTWRNRAPGTITGLISMPMVEYWFTR